jgi:hypothetical protein
VADATSGSNGLCRLHEWGEKPWQHEI